MVMYATSKVDYRRYQDARVVYGVLILTVILLLAVFGFPAINGARRWIRFPGFSFQPSEIAKIALPVFSRVFFDEKRTAHRRFKRERFCRARQFWAVWRVDYA
jgi:cell division protein FtsW (lipid II flippase)